MIVQNQRYNPKNADCSEKTGQGKQKKTKTRLFISLILIPYTYKLNEIVGTPNKIIAIITKIQNKQKRNDNSTKQ